MKRTRWIARAAARALVGAALVAAVGCGDDDGGGDDDDDDAVDAGGGADAPPGDTDAAASDAASPDGGAAAAVVWVTETEPVMIDSDIALEYAFEYAVVVPGEGAGYTLDVEFCADPADADPACTASPLEVMSGSSFLRFGIDPTQYAIGTNTYTFELTLSLDGEPVSSDTLTLTAEVTDCETCGTT
jgi:hypothetical protein